MIRYYCFSVTLLSEGSKQMEQQENKTYASEHCKTQDAGIQKQQEI